MSKPVIAIDMGGTRIKIGIVKDSTILASSSISADSGNGLKNKLPYIEKAVRDLLNQQELSCEDIAGLGIASPGIIDSHEKKVLSIDKKFGDAPGIDLQKWCRQAFNLPFTIENDARAALLGEWKYGKAKNYDNAVLMSLGTGVGSAAVMEGKLLRGKHFTAGILGGHFVINYKGEICNCGNKGCVETEASTWKLTSIAKDNNSFLDSKMASLSSIDYEAVFKWAEEGDSVAEEIRDQSLQAWSACAINLIHAYDPEILVLTGGIMASSSHIIPYIRQKIEQHAWTPWGKVNIEEAAFPGSAALYGMSYLVNTDQK
ncbi:ROK family protein [Chryseobacterium sp. L7]|uniref:ROK family protein n=1 Tax=Chryseobacterium endalhagicum TaxID=2797638 RepID=A0ABS1QDV2_9FLAO|nr:ROK family protein [Chryseobacterium endalhagicum]MBL1220784.1 ROK family protein [Chryseobacterium endalhagicum]